MQYPTILLTAEGYNPPTLVRQLKERLNYHGTIPPLDITNHNFGPTTEEAVKAFQRSKLLNDDGEVGPLTWHRLFTDRIPVIMQATTLIGKVKEYLLSQLYVREKTGKNDGPEVEAYLKAIGLGKGFAWCVALIYWAFEKASQDLGIKNPLPKTGGVLNLWNIIDPSFKIERSQMVPAEEGDLIVMDFGHGNGHLSFVKIGGKNKVPTIEGNTSAEPNGPSQDRDGQGVYERFRDPWGPKVRGLIRLT